VALTAVMVNVFDLEAHGVDTIGVLPQGLPALTIPQITWGDLPPLVLGALAIAVVALADTMSTASSFAARKGVRVEGNQEMIGIGAANIAAGAFQGFPVSTSGSRTAVADQAGSRSQVTGVVGAVVIAVVLLFANSLMRYVPQPTLGAVVIAAAVSLTDVAGMRRLWLQRRTEFLLSLIALLGVALLGVLPGILVAVGLSILNVFRRTWWPHQAELGRVEGIAGMHDTVSYPDAERLPGLVVYRFDAPLIFANARSFGETVREMAESDTTLRWIVVASEPITDVDTTAADMLEELDTWLNARDVSLVFAEMKDPVRAKIERYGLTRTIAPEHFLPTVDEAVAEYTRRTGVSWRDPKEPT
jgi:MFS superfamily sulfate permease-like transporter